MLKCKHGFEKGDAGSYCNCPNSTPQDTLKETEWEARERVGEKPFNKEEFDSAEISACDKCYSSTHTINGKCGKCKAFKEKCVCEWYMIKFLGKNKLFQCEKCKETKLEPLAPLEDTLMEYYKYPNHDRSFQFGVDTERQRIRVWVHNWAEVNKWEEPPNGLTKKFALMKKHNAQINILLAFIDKQND